MIVQPFLFGNVEGDLAAEFTHLEKWAATFLGQSDILASDIGQGAELSVLPSVAIAHVHSDSRLFNDGHHLQTLLNMIDSSYPFVFFILGDTYGNPYAEARHGTGERNMQISASLGHAWTMDKKIKQASLLHILVHYATLKSAGSPPGNNDDRDSGRPSPFVYIRRPSYERSVVLMTENGRFAHQRAPSVLADALRMDALKREILSNDIRMRFFDNSEQMINLIYADIQRCVRKITLDLKQPNVILTPTLDRLVDDLSHRVRFQPSNSKDKMEKQIFALVGEPQCGKHRLIYYWLSMFSEANPGIPVAIFHANPDAPNYEMNSVAFLMDEAIKKFRFFYKEFDRTLKGGRILECVEARQLHQVEQEFSASLALGPCLLVVAGLDFVSSGRYFGSGSEVTVKQLHWLPDPLPANCRVIVTTTSNDMTLKALLKRKDVDVLDVSILPQDPVFKETFLRNEAVAFAKFPHHLLANVMASPMSGSVMHLAAIGRTLANHGMLERLDFQVESLLELPRLRDLFAHELRKWTSTSSSSSSGAPLSPAPTSVSPTEDADRSSSWIPIFLRFMVLSRCGIPTRYIMQMLRHVMAIKSASQHQKVVERWWQFWQAAKFIFTGGHRNTLKLASENVRRSLSMILFDTNRNSFAVWRRRFIRFIHCIPNWEDDPVIVDEMIIQADQADDFARLLRLLSNGNSFSRLVYCGKNTEVFALSLLMRIESNSGGLFRYLVARWMNSLGVLNENVIGDGTSDRSSHISNEDDAIVLPEGALKRCEFAWLMSDWLFAVTRISPSDSDHKVTVTAFANLIPMVVRFCENELAQVPFDAEARSNLGGFLMRCSARFAAPRFNNLKLALQTMQHAAKTFLSIDEQMTTKANADMPSADGIEELGRLIESNVPHQFQQLHKLVRYSFVVAQLESCEMLFKLGDAEAARETFSFVTPHLEAMGSLTWPPIICRHLFCLSLFSQSSTNAEQCERFLRAAADTSTKWYGRKHSAVADTILALGCILASRATTPRPRRVASAAGRPESTKSKSSTTGDDLCQIVDSLFTAEEVEHCLRESISILEERRLSAGGDTERLSFACASLGRFLSNQPTSSAKREAVELLQKAADLQLLESGVEDFTVRWLRNIAKDTLTAMPPSWFTRLHFQQQAEDAVAAMAPMQSRAGSKRISATMFSVDAASNRARPATSKPPFNSLTQPHPRSGHRARPKTSLGLPSEYKH